MTFREQAEKYMLEIANRKGAPARATTLHVYRSVLDARVLPAIGGADMAAINNKTVKMLVGRLAEARLSPATISLTVALVKQIVASATDDEGTYLYPVKWNPKFIDAPRVDPASQTTPIASVAAITAALQTTSGEVGVLVALLAGTGLRVGEALALKASDWDRDAGTLRIHSTMVKGQVQPDPKTKAGNRVVDLDPSLNRFLSALLPTEGRLFSSPERTLHFRLAKLGIHGFHSLRRFRITYLQGTAIPPTLVKFWAGHAAGDITERYTKFGAQIQERKVWSEKAGLGFTL
jgi:integrase